METPLLIALAVGLFGTVHCLGMCGGIAGALTASVDPAQRQSSGRLTAFALTYSLGRISSYTVAGAITGALGGSAVAALGDDAARVAQWVAALFLAALGLYIAGWLPALARIERWGVPLWRRLQPVAQRLLPIQRLEQAYLFGLLWGWLPCGLVYSALIYTLGAGGAVEGATFMLMFGIGTLPSMVLTGVAAAAFLSWVRRPMVRRAFGLAIVAMAATTLVAPQSLIP